MFNFQGPKISVGIDIKAPNISGGFGLPGFDIKGSKVDGSIQGPKVGGSIQGPKVGGSIQGPKVGGSIQ